MDSQTAIRIICGIGAVILLLVLVYKMRSKGKQ
jgi:hypothetical protein